MTGNTPPPAPPRVDPVDDEPRAPEDEPVITADPERQQRQIRQDLYDAAHHDGGTDER